MTDVGHEDTDKEKKKRIENVDNLVPGMHEFFLNNNQPRNQRVFDTKVNEILN